MSITRMMAAALAAALSMPGLAQGSREVEERYRRATGQRPGEARPEPAPAQAPGAQGQAQATGQPAQGQAGTLTEEQRAALGIVWARNRLALQAGEMAQTRGASSEVQDLGRMLAEDHRRQEKELAWLVGQRGADVNALAAGPERERIEGELGQLNTKSGEEFDREFIAFLTRNDASFVDAMKRARDVTPGKDAALKKWLDDSENTEEGHLTAARQMKSKRQARTPPPR